MSVGKAFSVFFGFFLVTFLLGSVYAQAQSRSKLLKKRGPRTSSSGRLGFTLALNLHPPGEIDLFRIVIERSPPKRLQ